MAQTMGWAAPAAAVSVALLWLVPRFAESQPGQVPDESAQQVDPDRRTAGERVAWIAREAAERSGAAGLVVVALAGGEEAVAVGVGAKGPTADTPFAAGPAAQLLLAASCLHAAESLDVDLSKPLQELLPDRELTFAGVTLHTLLAHTSGLPIVPEPKVMEASAGEGEREEPQWLRWLRQAPPDAAVGTCYGWSNANVLLLDLWLTDATGKNAAQYAALHLFPLLEWSAEHVMGNGSEGWFEVTAATDAAGWVRAKLPGYLSGHQLRLSARQQAQLLDAVRDRRIVDESAAQAILGDVRLVSGELTGRGYGTARAWLDGQEGRSVDGGVAGTAVRSVHYPALGVTLCVVAEGGGPALAQLERALTRALFDLPQAQVSDLPLDGAELERHVGNYQIGCNSLEILVQNSRLHLRTEERAHPLAYQGGGRFAAQDGSELLLEFQYDRERKATQFLLRSGGHQAIARRTF